MSATRLCFRMKIESESHAFSLSVIVPAFNEEENIQPAILLLKEALESVSCLSAFEIIVVDDGSFDKTGEKAESLSKLFPEKIKYVKNKTNLGLGACYKRGLGLCRYEYVTWLAADGSYLKDELVKYFSSFSKESVPISYSYSKTAIKTRPLFRRFLSGCFKFLLYSLFDVRGINYINGVAIYRKDFLQSIPIHANGFALMAELLLRAREHGFNFKNVGMNSVERKKGKSKIFKIKNILDLIKTFSRLFVEFKLKI